MYGRARAVHLVDVYFVSHDNIKKQKLQSKREIELSKNRHRRTQLDGQCKRIWANFLLLLSFSFVFINSISQIIRTLKYGFRKFSFLKFDISRIKCVYARHNEINDIMYNSEIKAVCT